MGVAGAAHEIVLDFGPPILASSAGETTMTQRGMWMIAGALFVLPAACADPDQAMPDQGMQDQAMQDQAMQVWQDQTVADLEQMRDKLLSLAEAFPEETWDWAPMEGVRSVRDVMVLMVVEGHIFPGMWGADPAMGAASGLGAEIARVTAMSKADVIGEIERAWNYMIDSCRNMTAADQMADAEWFGQATTAAGVVGHAVADMHEHLGQSIAYARMNQIVPPWSM